MRGVLRQVMFAAALFLVSVAGGDLIPVAEPPAPFEVDLQTAEKLFHDNNLDLLAAKFGIEAAEAQRLQTSLWSNPNLQIEQNIYNHKTGKYFDVGKTGNTEFQVTQLVQISGRHGKQIRLSEFDKKISEFQFFDLIRNLKYQLRTTFFQLYWSQQSLQFYDQSLHTITKTIQTAEKAFAKRSLLLSEVLRLKAILSQLRSDRLDVVADIASAQSDLRTLMFTESQTGKPMVAKLDLKRIKDSALSLSLEQIVKVAKEHRPDLKLLEQAKKREEANLSLQRALTIPDLTVGLRYSRAGSYIPEYFGVLLGFNIPLFDQNQGNVRASEAQISLKQAQLRRAEMDLWHDLEASYVKSVEAEKAVRESDDSFLKDYDSLVEKMVHNYEQRNIGIIAFADFYESYRTSRIQFHSMHLKRLKALEELSLQAGSDVTDIRELIK